MKKTKLSSKFRPSLLNQKLDPKGSIFWFKRILSKTWFQENIPYYLGACWWVFLKNSNSKMKNINPYIYNLYKKFILIFNDVCVFFEFFWQICLEWRINKQARVCSKGCQTFQVLKITILQYILKLKSISIIYTTESP